MKAGGISFIIPYYNIPLDMLHECIESILTLSLQPDEREIIMVDDGSTTGASECIHQFSADIVYIRQENQGLSGARNTGISHAQGTFIQFVDADDKLISTEYNKVIEMLKATDVDMLLWDSQPCERMSGIDYMSRYNLHSSACGYVFKRAILDDLRFTQGILHEDDEFTPLLMLKAAVVKATDLHPYYYRMRQESITHQQDKTWTSRRLNDFKGVLTRLSQHRTTLPQQAADALQRRIAQLTMDYLYNTIRLTKSTPYLTNAIEELRKEGLFPLPDKDYTTKYKWFRRLINHPLGLKLLTFIIPLIKKER